MLIFSFFSVCQIRNAATDDELRFLNEDEVVINALVTAGFVNKHITKHNKEVACEKLIMHYSLMSRKL